MSIASSQETTFPFRAIVMGKRQSLRDDDPLEKCIEATWLDGTGTSDLGDIAVPMLNPRS